MTNDDEVVGLLRQAIERVGVTDLVRRPGLARNVLGDMLPDDPLAVALLGAAAEQGAVQRLQEQSDDDLRIVAPRLAGALASSRGLVPDQARWAVDTWALALGRSVPDRRPLVATAPSEAASPPAEAETRVAAEREEPQPATEPAATRRPPRTTRRAAPAPPAATHPAGPPPAAPPEHTAPAASAPEEPRRRRPRLGLLIGAAVALVVVATGVLLALNLPRGSASDLAWSRTAVVQPKGEGVVATVSHDMTKPLGGARVTLHNGDQVEVKRGPVEIRLGASAVRLDDGTTVTYTAGTARAQPLLTMTEGQIWITAAAGQKLALRSPSSEHADIESGRFLARCDNTCSYETLDEPQTVHTGGYAYRMKAHQRFTPSTASTESMDSQMDMGEPTTSASGGMSMASSPDPNMPKPEFVAPDVLRHTPWIAANLKTDTQQDRRYRSVDGRSLLGTWTLMLQRPDVPADLHRVVRFSLSHCDVATCVLTANSDSLRPDGALKPVRGRVAVDDARGDQVRITYDPTPVACRTPGVADGTQRLVDNLTFSGAGGSGSRVARYEPGPGSSCTSQKDRTVPAATIDIAAHRDLTRSNEPFTSPGPSESLVLGHVHGAPGSCSPNRQRMAGASADATCRPPSAAADGPTTIAYYSFPTVAALDAAYSAQVDRSKQARDQGDCSRGACERATPGGRRLIYGDAYLVETDTGSRMMVVANGSVRSQLAEWRPDQKDFTFSRAPVRGF